MKTDLNRPGNAIHRGLLAASTVALLCSLAGSARAQNSGFQINRYEPTPAGEWFFAVEHPWYSSTRYFAAGLTLNYAHNPVIFRNYDASGKELGTTPVIPHLVLGHIDLAGSFLDRVLLSASLPITLYQGTNAQPDVQTDNLRAGVGDLRFGAMVRLFGQPEASAISMSLGAQVWVPFGVQGNLSGDKGVRVAPKLVIGGMARWLRWSLNLSYLYRQDATLGSFTQTQGGNLAGQEIQLQAGLAYANKAHNFSIGPELVFGTQITNGAFRQNYSSLEVLVGAQYLIKDAVLIGIAPGFGALLSPGTPDFRLLARIAYAPVRRPPTDRDRDGILDRDDACADEPGIRTDNPRTNGCPYRDRDGDGVLDKDDICPDVPKGEHPDPKRLGCPAVDTDRDGVYDYEDVCPEVPMGPYPDPNRLGCPLADRDFDSIPDVLDACPDKPGAPDPDPKKNGCPGLVEVKNGRIMILEPVFFETNKDVIMPRSFALLQSVANVFTVMQTIRRVEVQGHTDDRGKRAHNMDLSNRRALSVQTFLLAHGVPADHLEAHGYGPDKPVATNATNEGRSLNRRVEFVILDPVQQPGAPGTDKAQPAAPSQMAPSETFPDAPHAKGKSGTRLRGKHHHRAR